MKKAYIYKLAMNTILEKIEHEQNVKAEAEKNGTPHRVADHRLERLWAEERELHQMILDAELNDE